MCCLAAGSIRLDSWCTAHRTETCKSIRQLRELLKRQSFSTRRGRKAKRGQRFCGLIPCDRNLRYVANCIGQGFAPLAEGCPDDCLQELLISCLNWLDREP